MKGLIIIIVIVVAGIVVMAVVTALLAVIQRSIDEMQTHVDELDNEEYDYGHDIRNTADNEDGI